MTHERIYLQIADDDGAVLGHSPDRVGPTDIEYVRADLHVAVQAELARLEADNARLRSLLRALLHDVKFAISSGDWRVDGRCDPTITIERAEEALAGGDA